jgi:hypothetical protein
MIQSARRAIRLGVLNKRQQGIARTRQIRNGLVLTSAYKSCPVENERCVSCHMSKVELPGAHFQFTDHRIRIVRPGDSYRY